MADKTRDTMSGTTHTTTFSTEDVSAIIKLKDFVEKQPIFQQLLIQKVDFNWSECCPAGCDVRGNVYLMLAHAKSEIEAQLSIYPLLIALWEQMDKLLNIKVVYVINDKDFTVQELSELIK